MARFAAVPLVVYFPSARPEGLGKAFRGTAGPREVAVAALVARRQRSPFRRPEDVLQVKGFGPGWLQKAKGNITVAGAPTAGASAVASETPRR